MDITITYVHHNCFVMQTGNRTYLFDYPGDTHLPPGAADLVRGCVADADLAVFISHGHEDHLNQDLASVTGVARRVRYVLSDDIEELRPDAVPGNGEVLVVEPDEAYVLGSMRIETLLSNDLGVAFLVEDGEFRFYFGGDLAKWIWKSATAQEAAYTASFFREAMDRVRVFRPHVAFSNVDKRLSNLAGGAEAYRECGAEVFVPMHTFGDTDWPPEFIRVAAASEKSVFLYTQSGDVAIYSIGQ